MKKTFRQLCAWCTAWLLMLTMFPYAVSARENITQFELQATDLSANTHIEALNMFPGDEVSQTFDIQVRHKQNLMLFFRAYIRPGYRKLSEVLKIRVEVPGHNETLYDGLMADMPGAVCTRLSPLEQHMLYTITVYLDKSVGNEYQQKNLVADFNWWYASEEPGHSERTAAVKLTAEAVLDNNYAIGNDYTFQLIQRPEGSSEPTIIETVKNTGGYIEFRTLRFNKPGTYTYYMIQKKGSSSQIIYDDVQYEVIIDVTEKNGKLQAAVNYRHDGITSNITPRFVNWTSEGLESAGGSGKQGKIDETGGNEEGAGQGQTRGNEGSTSQGQTGGNEGGTGQGQTGGNEGNESQGQTDEKDSDGTSSGSDPDKKQDSPSGIGQDKNGRDTSQSTDNSSGNTSPDPDSKEKKEDSKGENTGRSDGNNSSNRNGDGTFNVDTGQNRTDPLDDVQNLVYPPEVRETIEVPVNQEEAVDYRQTPISPPDTKTASSLNYGRYIKLAAVSAGGLLMVLALMKPKKRRW